MDANRKHWNEQQQTLRKALASPDDLERVRDLFLAQHAAVHALSILSGEHWSFEQEVWEGLSESVARRIPAGGEHSIAWLTWHMARIEDATLGVLAAGEGQLLLRDNWLAALQVERRDTGNLMPAEEVAQLSQQVNLDRLRAYRLAVGRRTQQIVSQITAEDLKRKVDPARLKRLLEEGAVLPVARDLLDYWGGLTIAGLLLMPPTRHNFVHLNEALKLKKHN